MKIAIGSDHRGFELKAHLVKKIVEQGHEVIDKGCYSSESCDYPDIANYVADEIIQSKADRGILICGSGVGMSIAANRHKNIRAVLCNSKEIVELSRLHNNANVIVLGAAFISPDEALNYINLFLITDFESGRHEIRLNKIS